MTVGAAPEYVKVQAAIYADGATAGVPERIAQLLDRRRFLLDTTRELIRRIEKAKADGWNKVAVESDLRQWSDSLPPQGRQRQVTQQSIDQQAGRERIAETISALNAQSFDEVVAKLRTAEDSLASSKPPL